MSFRLWLSALLLVPVKVIESETADWKVG